MPKGEYLQYGGQAILEGVMMRSPRYYSVACRAPNGQIVLHSEPIEKTWIGRQRWLRAPFLRGTFALLDSMALGIRAMRFSGDVQLAPEFQKREELQPTTDEIAQVVDAPSDESGHLVTKSPEGSEVVRSNASSSVNSVGTASIVGAMIVGLALGVFLFVISPNFITEYLDGVGLKDPTLKNFVAGVLKIVFFLAYIGVIGLYAPIRALFQYHGAEHKAINTMEDDAELTLENCKQRTRLHPRCGTSFAIIVLLLSLLAFTFVPRYPLADAFPPNSGFIANIVNTLTRVGIEVLLLPIIAGISYEALKVAGKFRNQMWMRAAFWPGLMTQYLTTREPDDTHIEVALTALRGVLEQESGADAEKSTVPEAVSA